LGISFLLKGNSDGTALYFPFQKPKTASIVPAKLVKKIQPDYPAEAQEKKIEGTVKLQVIVRKDGSVTVQNVLEGDPILSPAAIEAVGNGATSLGCSTVSRLKCKRQLRSCSH